MDLLPAWGDSIGRAGGNLHNESDLSCPRFAKLFCSIFAQLDVSETKYFSPKTNRSKLQISPPWSLTALLATMAPATEKVANAAPYVHLILSGFCATFCADIGKKSIDLSSHQRILSWGRSRGRISPQRGDNDDENTFFFWKWGKHRDP